MAREVNVPINIGLKVSGEGKIKELERQVRSLEDEVQSYRSKWEEATRQVMDFQRQLENVRNVSGIAALEEELEVFKATASQAEDEVRNFLRAMNMDELRHDSYISDLINDVKKGALTANQAIASIKANFQHVMEDNYYGGHGLFDSQQVQTFLATLDELSKKVDIIHDKIVRIETDGVSVASGGGGGGGFGANLSEQFKQIAITAEAMSEKGNAAVGQIVAMTTALNEFGGIDVASLLQVAHTFENIANIGQGSFSSKSVDNLVDLARKISNINQNGDFRFSFNLEGLKDFKVSSTIHHLSDFLATLNEGQISSLERLSRINLSNFHQDNLKISKATTDNLAEMVKVEQAQHQEAEAVKQTDAAYQEHQKEVEAAAKAEEDKAKISELLAKALEREEERTKSASKTSKEHADAVEKQMDAMWAERRADGESLNGLYDSEKIEGEISRAIAERIKQKDAETAAAEKAQIAWEKEEQAKLAAEEKAAKAAEEAARRKEEADRKAAEAAEKAAQKRAEAEARAAEKALREQQKLEEAQRKAEQLAAYKDASRTVNRYYGLLTSKDTNASKRQDVTMTEAGWVSASGKYAELAAQLNDATAAYNMLTDAQNKNGMSAEQVAEINATIATRQKDYNLAVENAAAKEQESAERAAESARAKAQQAEETQKAKEAKRQETEATKAQAAAEKEEAAARREAERSERQYASTLKQINNAIVQCENAQRKYAFAAKLGVGKEDYSKIQNASKRLSELRSELERTGAVTPEIAAEFRKLSEQVSTASANLKTNGGLIGGWATTGVEQLKSRLTYSLGLAAMVYKAAGEIKKMISTAVELDTAMNQLQIVTRSSSADMDVYAKRVSSMAKETAQATKDLIDATTVYARLGYSIDESAELAKRTAQLQGVGGIDPSAAQDAMTAILKAFNKNVDDVEDVMNKLVVVGNNFPISVSQLAEGMNNAGSMLAVAGNSLEQSIALLTAANTTVQDISKASTGLRTIAARIRKTKTELDDLGEAINESKYEEMIQALAGKGVSLTDAEGQYRSTYNVLKDIARVWNDLGSMDQAAIIESLAGTRQQNVFSSLITQFQEAEGAMDSMQDSAGELEEAYGIYLDSIEAHTKTLKAAFDELSRDFVDSSFAKGVIDLLTGIVEALDLVVNKIGILGTLISAGGLVLLIKNLEKVKLAIAGIAEYQAAMAASGGMAWLAGGVSLGAVIPVLLGIAAAIAAIVVAVKAYNEAHPSLKQLREDARAMIDEVNESKQKIDQLSKAIEENKERIEDLNEIKNEGDWSDTLQAELDKLNKENESLQDQLELEQKIAEYRQKTAVAKTNAAIDAWNSTPQSQTVKMNIGGTAYTVTENAKTGYGGLQNVIESYESHKQRIKEINEELADLPAHFGEAEAARVESLREELGREEDAAGDALQSMREFYDELIEYENALWFADPDDEKSIKNLGLISQAINLIAESADIGDKGIDRFKRRLDRLSEDTLKKLVSGADLTSSEMKELEDWMNKCGYSANDAAKFFERYVDELRDAADVAEDAVPQKALGDLTSLQDELSETTKALDAYKEAMKGGEKGDAVKEMADIYKGALEDLKSGRVDSRRVHNAAELFFSQEQLAAMNYDMAEIGKALQSSLLQSLFNPEGDSEQSYGQRFAKYIEDNAAKFAKAGAAVEKTSKGYRFHYDSLQELADAFDMSTEACSAFLDDLDAYGVEVMRSTEENAELTKQFLEVRQGVNSAREAVIEFIKHLHDAGRDSMEIQSILNDLAQDGVIQLNSKEINEVLAETMDGLNEIDKESVEPSVELQTASAYADANTLHNYLLRLFSQTITQTVHLDYQGEVSTRAGAGYANYTGQKGNGGSARAKGGVTGKAGPTLVNELGPELISDRGKAFIANNGEPGFVSLSKDAIVFTADETKEIAKNGGFVSSGMAYASGTKAGLIDRLVSGKDVPSRANTWVCGVCGSRNDPSATVCWHCKASKGATSSKSVASTVSSGASKATITTTTSKPTSSTSGKTPSSLPAPSGEWVCSICGYPNSLTRDNCAGCGWPRGTMASAVYSGGSKVTTASNDAGKTAKSLFNTSSGSTSKAYQGISSLFDFSGNGGAGGGTGGGAASESRSNPQKIDWIAVRLNRIQRAVQDLDKVASSGLKKLSTRLDSAKKEVSKLNEEISTAQQGYNRYIQEANSVGLSSDLAERVRNGTIDINSYDDDTRQKIQEYQEWYEKALDCSSAVEDLNQQIGELYRTNFDLVHSDYANQLSLIEHEMNMINADISMASAKGMLDSAVYYDRLVAQEVQNINKLKEELGNLQSYFNEAINSGKIAANSEEWYAMKQEILGVEEAIADANVQLQEYRNTIRDINWSYFDYAQERFSALSQEANFLINLLKNSNLFDERGQFSNSGYATVGMRVINYDTYMKQADEYAKEILKIESSIAGEPNNKELINRRVALIQLQQQSISAAEQEKEAVRSLVQEGIQLELASLKDLIDAYKNSLDSAKSLYDYQKKISDKTQGIAAIQKQLAAYQNDTSEETRAKVQKLNKDLEKAQTDLMETEREQSISDQKKLLDDVYGEYEDLMNARLDDINLLMKEMIDASNANAEIIRAQIQDVTDRVGYDVTAEMQTAMNGHYANYDRIFDGIAGATNVLTNIYNNVNAMARAAGAVKAYAKGGLVDYTGLAAVHGTPGNPELVLSAADTEKFLQAAQMMQVMNGIAPSMTRDISALIGSSGGGGMNIGGITLDISIDHVQDYNDFVTQLQADPKFEKLIDAMTMGRMLGGSKLAKNGIRF